MQLEKSFPSPNGRYRLELYSHELPTSQRLNCPYLFDAVSNDYLFSAGQHWDASKVEWSSDSNELKLDLRHYGQDYAQITVTLILDKNAASIYTSGNGTFSRGSLSTVGGELANTTEFRTLFY